MTMPQNQCCADCRFSFATGNTNEMLCRRYPPTWQGIDKDGIFWASSPFTQPSHWCGEFTEAPGVGGGDE